MSDLSRPFVQFAAEMEAKAASPLALCEYGRDRGFGNGLPRFVGPVLPLFDGSPILAADLEAAGFLFGQLQNDRMDDF
jgi:hypothetical protein